jgi:plastocyanin
MRVLVMAAVALLAVPAAARADVASVAIPGKLFSPAQVTVVAGDSVSWRNADLSNHDVKAVDGGFDSGPLGRFSAYATPFTAVGVHPFFCTIHPFMTGSVNVVAATLEAPAAPVFGGEAVELMGRAPAGTDAVALERQDPSGAWVAAGTAMTMADGHFHATVRPEATAAYRARTSAGESPPVTVTVSSQVELDVSVTRHALRVRTTPARPGLLVTVQRWARWRFDWRVAGRAKLDARGRAEIKLPEMTGKARVLLQRSARGPALLEGRPLQLRTGRPTRVP